MQANLWQMLVAQLVGTISYSATHSVATKEKVRVRVHHYQLADKGVEFVCEPANHGYQVMTAQRSGVKCGDRIAFHTPSGHQEYRVADIEYYCDPPDMWIAKLWPYS
ncbi:MAG: hypothetical protein HC852_10370 [Acaryochloridaceae cyanobacterium RU_4_10]|nr:hypothetical protein [Acaryochloridaceae cyanobacterium RU_4_10]